MTTASFDQPSAGSLGYRCSRLLAAGFNSTQMAMAEAYINGLEIPDALYRGMIHASMPILFRHFPALLAPYEWVLNESDRIAESAKELMEIQYDRPQQMLGDWEPIYPKYSTGFWENGAEDLEASQRHMIDQMIDRLGIEDGDHLLDFGCGWGCVPNYILSKFPNLRCTGVNLSRGQCAYMRAKMNDPRSQLSSGRFTLVEATLMRWCSRKNSARSSPLGCFAMWVVSQRPSPDWPPCCSPRGRF